MKLLGLLLLVCSGAGIGFWNAAELRNQHRNLESLCRLLRELSVQMAFHCPSMRELFAQIAAESAYAAFSFPAAISAAMEREIPLPDAWRQAISQDAALSDEAKRRLLPLGEELGASDLDGQLATLSQYRQQLEPYVRETGERLAGRRRLYCSLGLLGGFLAAILLA